MKYKTAQPTIESETDRSLSPLQTIALLATLVLAGTAAFLGSKNLLDELPDTTHSDASDYIWSELERSVNALSN